MALRLVKGSYKYRDQMIEMLKEWIAYNNAHLEANPSPAVIFKNDYHDFDHYLSHLDYIEPHDGLVPASTFFCLDDERNIMVGAVNIRHKLNEYLLQYGGHIGDGIRPGERGKGYATRMISLALEECKKLGIRKVLMVCDKENIGSAKSILKNGGSLLWDFAGDGNCSNFFAVVRKEMESEEYGRCFEDFEWPWYMPSREDYAEIVAASGFSSCNISEVNRDRFFCKCGRDDQVDRPAQHRAFYQGSSRGSKGEVPGRCGQGHAGEDTAGGRDLF